MSLAETLVVQLDPCQMFSACCFATSLVMFLSIISSKSKEKP